MRRKKHKLYPKIGIRPVIDGHWGGIRESLEDQTMGLATAAKELIETLRYPDGTPVQAVISPCTIGGGAMGIMGSFCDTQVMQKYLGIRAEWVDMTELLRRITLASMLRIPVTMHNVAPEKVYRPHAWTAFGTQDTQAADYAACKHYGPLYGKL
ncbi:MAG: hypothetical protein IJQ33_08100 [Clostridia bacterium]|nr:hypothetical protein [Clostridia bacterium]